MIQLILNNEFIQTTEHRGKTLLDFIRENRQLKGTKIGCREGDCGACTVLVGSLKNKRMEYHSITSCISPLGNANGKHIVTIEGVNLKDQLNVVQQSMSDAYATQCGFCTPGFVVSMTGHVLHSNCRKRSGLDAISGNICRCTGYKSIEKALVNVENKIKVTQQQHHLEWLIQHKFIPEYFKEIPERIEKIELAALPQGDQTVANGTDLYVQKADDLFKASLNMVGLDSRMKWIRHDKHRFILGANTTVSDILAHEDMRNMIPNLPKFIKLVSSEQIRNMGTLGGNFVNASPIGDMSVFFLALDSMLTLQCKDGTRRDLKFNRFFKQYKEVDLKPDELVFAISFLKFDNATKFNFEKVSKRTHLDIASVNSAIRISTDRNQRISDVHISLGGVSGVPKYLQNTNAYLLGKEVTPLVIREAEEILQSEIEPISDIRGSKVYKRLLARQLFYAHFVELFPERISLKNLVNL